MTFIRECPDARRQGHQGQKILNGRALSASQIKSTECQNSVGAACGKDGYRCCSRTEEEKECVVSLKPTSNGGLGGDYVKDKEGAHVTSLLKDLQFESRQNSSEKCEKSGVNKNGKNSAKMAKRGHEGFFGKRERQPNRRGGRENNMEFRKNQ